MFCICKLQRPKVYIEYKKSTEAEQSNQNLKRWEGDDKGNDLLGSILRSKEDTMPKMVVIDLFLSIKG